MGRLLLPRKSRRSSLADAGRNRELETAGNRRLFEEINPGNGETTMESKPTHEQAQLHLHVYDQRREAKLRQARDWFGKNYIVNNIDDAMRIAPMEASRAPTQEW